MKMDVASVSSKGQVVIPSELRKTLGLEAGSKLAIFTDGVRILMKPLRPPHPAQFRRLSRESDRELAKSRRRAKAD